MEYKQFAKYYDSFYQKKNYENEVCFLLNFIEEQDNILDIGCGTGVHASLLEKEGYRVDGLDLNREMLKIAQTRLHGTLYNQNILDLKIDKKYNLVISMFAVINHLKNIDELEKVLFNLKKVLLPNGKIIIDLHNPQDSGHKTDSYQNITRTMIWKLDKEEKIETSDILFEIDGFQYQDSHIFQIFSIEDVQSCCQKVGLQIIDIYENYNIDQKGTEHSKNLQFLIKEANFNE